MAEASKYSEKFRRMASSPSHRGAIFQEDAAQKGMALIEAKEKDIKIYWLITPDSDKIYSAKFFTYGGTESVAIGEALSSLVKGRTVNEAAALKAADVEESLRDDPRSPAVAGGKMDIFNIAETLVEKAVESYPEAKAIALARAAAKGADAKPSVDYDALTEKTREWLSLDKAEQVKKIESVLDGKVRDYLQFDGGDVSVIDVVDSREVIVEYQGTCGSCASSYGSTLAVIEQTLRDEIFEDIRVTPNSYWPA